METVASQKCRSGIFACEVQEEMEPFSVLQIYKTFTTAIHRGLMREKLRHNHQSLIACNYISYRIHFRKAMGTKNALINFKIGFCM